MHKGGVDLFRVYDTEKKKWLTDGVYLNQRGELFYIKESFLSLIKKLVGLNSDRYIFHMYIGLEDKNNNSVYEGDYLKAVVAEDEVVIGMVAYETRLASYVILCPNRKEFFSLGKYLSDRIEVIGNVFDNEDLKNEIS